MQLLLNVHCMLVAKGKTYHTLQSIQKYVYNIQIWLRAILLTVFVYKATNRRS